MASDKMVFVNDENDQMGADTGTSTKPKMSASPSIQSLNRERTDISLSVCVFVYISFLTSAFFVNVDGAVFAPTL